MTENTTVTTPMRAVYMKNCCSRFIRGICATPAFSNVPRACDRYHIAVTRFLQWEETDAL